MNIDKKLFPKSNRLIIKNKGITAVIVDKELDTIGCSFHYDNCVELNTEGYTYLTLSRENLEQLIDLIDRSEAKYKQLFKNK
jgi:hypothetical protein